MQIADPQPSVEIHWFYGAGDSIDNFIEYVKVDGKIYLPEKDL